MRRMEADFDRAIGSYDPNMDREAPTADQLEIIAETDPELAHDLAQFVDPEEDAYAA